MMNYIKYVTGYRTIVGSMSTLNMFHSKKKTSFQPTNQRLIVPSQSIVTRPFITKLKTKSLDFLQENVNIHQMNGTVKNKANNSMLSLTSILYCTLYTENTSLDNLTVILQSNHNSDDSKLDAQQNDIILGTFNGDVLKNTQSGKIERKSLKYLSATANERSLLKYPDNLMCPLFQTVLIPETYCWSFQNEEHGKSLFQKSLLPRIVKYRPNEHANVGRVVMVSLPIKSQNCFFDKCDICRDLAGEKQHKRNKPSSKENEWEGTGDIQSSNQPNVFTKEQQTMVVYYVFFQCLTFSLYYIRQALDGLDTDFVEMIKPFSLYIIHIGYLLLYIYIKWIFKSRFS